MNYWLLVSKRIKKWPSHGLPLPVNSSHDQLVTRSTRHIVNSSHDQLVTRSSHHIVLVNSSHSHKQLATSWHTRANWLDTFLVTLTDSSLPCSQLVTHCVKLKRQLVTCDELTGSPPTNPAMHLREKFLSLTRYNLFMGVNEMCIINITVTVSVRVSVTVSYLLAVTVWWREVSASAGRPCA